MNWFRFLFLFVIGLLLCTACTQETFEKENLQIELAKMAVDKNPQEALRLLANIDQPEALEQDRYMHYVVTRTQAKYMDYQDITSDTIIFAALHYFADHKNYEMAARASYYVASLYNEIGIDDQSFTLYLQANYYAKQANNELFTAKSSLSIGNRYFEQELLDSAEIYFQQALENYNRIGETDPFRLEAMFMLGRSYRGQTKADLALESFTSGLNASINLNIPEYEAQFLRNIGSTYRDQKNYSLAKTYYEKSLEKKQAKEDELLVYLNYARIYQETGQPDSTKYYLDKINNQLSEIKYPYNRKAVFEELARYYEKEGNTTELRRYIQLTNAEDRKIEKGLNQEKMILAAKQFEEFQLKAQKEQSRTIQIGLSATVVLLALVGGTWHQLKNKKKKLQKSESRQRFQEFHQAKKAVECYRWVSHEEEAYSQLFREHYPNVPLETIREIFVKQQAVINELFSEWSRQQILEHAGGAQALEKLSSEDLCFIHLHHMGYSDETITQIMGYPFYSESFMGSRWAQIRIMLTEAGIDHKDINELLPTQNETAELN